MIDKATLRSQIKATRNTRASDEIAAARRAIRGHVVERAAALHPGSRIAGYEPMRTEPGSVELLAALEASGFEVVVPLTLPDNDLDWFRWSPAEDAQVTLGLDAVASAALVLVPAFAVDGAGRRLGRGGGSYDRALARVDAGAVIAALVYDDEVVPQVPTDDWDAPVSAVVTPSGWRDLQPFPRP